MELKTQKCAQNLERFCVPSSAVRKHRCLLCRLLCTLPPLFSSDAVSSHNIAKPITFITVFEKAATVIPGSLFFHFQQTRNGTADIKKRE